MEQEWTDVEYEKQKENTQSEIRKWEQHNIRAGSRRKVFIEKVTFAEKQRLL